MLTLEPPLSNRIPYFLNMSNLFLLGISPFLDCNFGVNGQQGYVELEVCNMAKAISRTAIVSPCVERRKEPVHWGRSSNKCNTLRQGCKLIGSQTVLDNIFLTISYSFFFLVLNSSLPFYPSEFCIISYESVTVLGPEGKFIGKISGSF